MKKLMITLSPEMLEDVLLEAIRERLHDVDKIEVTCYRHHESKTKVGANIEVSFI